MPSIRLPFTLSGFRIARTQRLNSVLLVEAAATQPTRPCPTCHHWSARIHSRYLRVPRDLPIAEYAVRLRLHVRRFFCTSPACPRRTFAERLPDIVPFRAQRTCRLTQALQTLGFALSGEAAARLSGHLRMAVSADTLLRIVRQTAHVHHPTPRVLGVDDFALRRGRVYGTILVDLEQHRPVDLLPDRTAEHLAQWLHAHPGVAIIARDRSLEYARGARLGAPDAVQVADRWHLLHNLREAVERVLHRRRSDVRKLVERPPTSDEQCPDAATRPRRLRPPTQNEQIRQQEQRARRYQRFLVVRELLAQGVSQRRIARLTGLSRAIVRQFVHAAEFPERSLGRPVASGLDPYLPYLHDRWNQGCSNSMQLWRELQTPDTGALKSFHQPERLTIS